MLKLTKEKLETADLVDIQALAFFVQTVCHLNPRNFDMKEASLRPYLEAADRVQTLLVQS